MLGPIQVQTVNNHTPEAARRSLRLHSARIWLLAAMLCLPAVAWSAAPPTQPAHPSASRQQTPGATSLHVAIPRAVGPAPRAVQDAIKARAPKSPVPGAPFRAVAGTMRSVKALSHHLATIRAHSPKGDDEENGTDFLESYLYFLQQRAYPNDTIDWSAYDRAALQRDQMPPAHLRPTGRGAAANWTFLGPTNLPVPYEIYYGMGSINGRVNSVVFDPANANTFYLASAGGGLWKTTDAGKSWTALTDTWRYLQASGLAIDPTSGALYVGTGDFDGYGGLSNGLMKSMDGGVTWSTLGSADFGNADVSKVVLDPEDPQVVLVTTGHGAASFGKIWRSADGGTSWTAVVGTAGVWCDAAYSAKDTNGTRTYYASGYDSTGDGKVLQSSDRGVTWSVSKDFGTGVNGSFVRVATSPTNPMNAYAIVGGLHQIWKSTDAGKTWTDTTNNLPGGYNWSQDFYDLYIQASTKNSGAIDVLYAGLIDIDQSPDSGANWRSIGMSYTNQAIIHNDQHTMAINPANPNDALAGMDGGIYRMTYDPVADTTSFASLNAHLGITQFYKIALHPSDPSAMIGGAQDNATPVSIGDLNNWLDVGGGDGGFAAINPQNPAIEYATSQGLGVYRTANYWTTSSFIPPPVGGDNVAFIAPIALDPTNPGLLYAGSDHLYLWSDATQSWTGPLGSQKLTTGTTSYIVVAPSDSSTIYTGASDGQVWMTANAGSAWTEIDSGTPSLPKRAITTIQVSPTNPHAILVGVSGTGAGHLWRCNDTTATNRTWTDISGSGGTALPDISLNALALDIEDPNNTYYAGTDAGVFVTTDGGANWSNATTPLGLPDVQVNDLKASPGTGYLNAGTYGRGMWRVKLATSTAPASLTLSPRYLAGGSSTTATVTLTNPAPSEGIFVSLLSGNPALAPLPTSLYVPPGAKSASVTIATPAVTAINYVNLAATYGGVSKTAILTITVVGAPPPPTGLAVKTGNQQLTLTWNAVAGAKSYNVKRSTTPGGPYSVIAIGVTATTYTDKPLVNGTTYYYVVSATNSKGEGPDSAEANGTPLLPPPTIAASPGNGQVTVTWSAAPNATSYNVKRSTTSGGPYTVIAAAITATRYVDKPLTNGTTYYYVVSGNTPFGETVNSNEASATPLPPPAAPTGVTATGLNGQVNLSWNAVATATSYNVKRALTSGGPYTVIANGITTTTFADKPLTNGTPYFYVVSAVNGGGESPDSSEVSATPIAPPDTPANVRGKAGNAKATILWDAAARAATYTVRRSSLDGGPYTVVASGITGTQYTDTGLVNGSAYFYVVSAVNSSGESANSAQTAVYLPGYIPLDLDGDGHEDLLLQNQSSGGVIYWDLTNGQFIGVGGTIIDSISTDWKVVGTPDINGDGQPDILWQNQKTGGVYYWIMNGAQYTGQGGYIIPSIDTNWKVVSTPDINRDGNADILWQNQQTGGVYYWLMNGPYYTGFGNYIISSISNDWKVVGTPDLNGDGKPDILWQNQSTGGVYIWLMNGAVYTGIGNYIIPSISADWKVVATPDINADGEQDLVWQNQSTGGVYYWLMSGTQFSGMGAYIIPSYDTAFKVVAPH